MTAQKFNDRTVNRFRAARGQRLAAMLSDVAKALGRKVHVLDVGGRSDYWENVPTEDVSDVTLVNYDAAELDRELPQGRSMAFHAIQGDARDLSDHADGSVDFVHSNSVIEHVGPWDDMAAMASEVRRVGRAGWIQTPAFEFPIEPHFRAPFLHWFGQPLRRRLMVLSPHYRRKDLSTRRLNIDRINLLSRAEVDTLFPGSEIYVERLALFPKSYVAWWVPSAAKPANDTAKPTNDAASPISQEEPA